MVHHKAELQFPDTFNDTATKCFLTDYFESSNNPHAHEESANYFSEDGVFSIGPEKAQGRVEITTLRNKMWDSVPGREHRAHRIFPFQTHKETGKDEFMVYGTVTYKHHDGASKDTEWAGRIELVKDTTGEIKIALLHCFLDTANMK